MPPSADPGPALRLLPCGDSAVLAELDSLAHALGYFRGLQAARPAGVVDIVPAARTVLVVFDSAVLAAAAVRTWMRSTVPATAVAVTGRTVEIGVRYDGPDLAEVAQFLCVGEGEVVALHSGSEWTAAFTGFAPGFAYLVSDHERLRVPRRNTPRTSVPAGSVGLAGEFSGIYPTASPGGWQLIGWTEQPLWRHDDDGSPVPLIVPGTTVKFRPL